MVHQDPSEDPDYEEESPEPPARGGHDSYAYTPKKVKVKTVTPVTKKLKAQGSGMSMADYKACNSVIIKLIASKVSLLFRNPVGKFDVYSAVTNMISLTLARTLRSGQEWSAWVCSVVAF